MKVLIDANVLYPTVMREVVLGVAKAGLFTPLWSARILEEWARAARKLGPEGEAQARAEIAMVRADWPGAEVPVDPGLEGRLWLPDPADVHVLSAAIRGSADAILSENAKDFPRGVLAEEGLERWSVDPFLMRLWADHPDAVEDAAETVRQKAEELSGEAWPIRKLMRKARLPRLGKALET
ncbi:RSP_2648 family PIN domain-containing protein [Pseudoruegeria sp. HB172150]|uniref:RSP_2648 family PIN domain-containing protein n=1 Tax=Pseudoruegeria sp. HB172150 TaxID=2721164 RepID=UPI0015579AFD|nr:PIN domain-containing protein [Pseudoruegeria sp. HB172150]